MRFSNPVKPEEIEQAYLDGMPKVSELEDGKIYKGSCRNARKAMWVAEVQKFIYVREKFGSRFLEDINHPANDNGFDLFIPTKEIETLTEEEKFIFDRGLAEQIAWLKKWKT